VEFEKFNFRLIKQGKTEKFDQFVTRLRMQANACDFHDTDVEIKSQIICGCYSAELRRRCLREEMELKEVTTLGRSFEVSPNQAFEIEQAITGNNGEVNYLSKQNERLATIKPVEKMIKACGYCGRDHVYDRCPAKGKRCNSCGKNDHFAVVCRGKKRNETRLKRQANSIEKGAQGELLEQVDDDKSSDDEHEVHYVNRRVNMIHGVDDEEFPYTVIKINKHEISVMMDTGASLNIIDEVTYHRMGADKPKLSKSRVRLFGYNSDVAIPIVAEFKTIINCKKKSIEAIFVIVKGTAKRLIGYKTLKELGVMQIINNLGGDVYNAVTVDQMKRRFPGVFTDKLGKFKRYEINLQIDENVKPTFMRHRRVPYSMRDSMTKCINELLQADVIEPATGPTSWLLPALAVKKRDGSMRLVVDGSHTKLAIQRTRYVIPTIEEVTAEIDSACIFSKLDVRKAFHQLVLAEPSRYITTFSTHMGIFRYKRLYMGIPPAPEIFQKVLDEV
jgi:hypothetical protein